MLLSMYLITTYVTVNHLITTYVTVNHLITAYGTVNYYLITTSYVYQGAQSYDMLIGH